MDGLNRAGAHEAVVLPAPWHATECEIDLRPGGIFRAVMAGPNGVG